MAKRYARVLRFVSEHPWCILPATLDSIVEMLELRAAGQMFTDEEIQARIGSGPRPAPVQGGPVAVIPLYGVIAPRLDVMTQISGGTSVSAFTRLVRAAVDDPDITAIVLDVASPGGNVFGIEEGAAALRAVRGRKPIVAVANHLMASAAYWLASQADEVLASPSSQVGSIGALGVHTDISEAEAKEGIKTTLITAGKFKGDGNEHEPLSDTARATMQQLVDSYYAAFVRDVGRGRAVTEQQVREGMGEGRILGARDALRVGLVDGIATLEQAVARLASGSKRASVKAEGDPAVIVAAFQTEVERLAHQPVVGALKAALGDQDAAAAEREEFRRRLAAHGA